MDKKLNTLLTTLKKMDFLMLYDVYQMRCLSLNQAWLLYYKPLNIPFAVFVKKRVYPLIQADIIQIEKYGDNYAIFLQNDGVELLRLKYNIASEVYDAETGRTVKGYQTAGSLMLRNKLINHQIAMNQFVLEFRCRFKRLKDETTFKYYDEKYVSKYKFIRPDGLISMNGVDLFLEMDMNTESKRQLLEKWNRYRIFMNTQEYVNQKNKVVILFIIDCAPSQIQQRKDLVLTTLYNTLVDGFDDKFDVFIGTKAELLATVFDKIIPENNNSYLFDKIVMDKIMNHKFKFTVGQGDKMKKLFKNSSYTYYIRKINNAQRITIENGKIQEFLLDEHLYCPVSTLNKIALLKRNSSIFKLTHKRDIEYIVVAKNMMEIYHQVKICQLLNVTGVFYTTPERLAKLPLHQALCSFDDTGNVFRYTDSGLTSTVFEYNLHEKNEP